MLNTLPFCLSRSFDGCDFRWQMPEGTTRADVAMPLTVLAALALVGLTLSLERGNDLRSRCLLFPRVR